MVRDILEWIFNSICFLLLDIFLVYLVNFLKTKAEAIVNQEQQEQANKYIAMLDKVVRECVIATNQTFVSQLKSHDKFGLEEQREAFKLTFEAVLAILTDDGKEALQEAYGDLGKVIQQKIEAEVNKAKGDK